MRVGALTGALRLCAEAKNFDVKVGGAACAAAISSSSLASAVRLKVSDRVAFVVVSFPPSAFPAEEEAPNSAPAWSALVDAPAAVVARTEAAGLPRLSRRVHGFDPAGDLFALVRGDTGNLLRGSGEVGDERPGSGVFGGGEGE